MEIAIFILLALLIALSAVMLFREFSRVNERVQKLEERVNVLEKANRSRMPWQALEDLEHARSALNREKEERMFLVSLIENAEAWIEKAQTLGTKREEK